MVFVTFYQVHLNIIIKTVTFLYVKANSKEICLEISFPFFRKMLMSAILLRLKANYPEKLCGYPQYNTIIYLHFLLK